MERGFALTSLLLALQIIQSFSLRQNQFDLIQHTFIESPECLTVLFELDNDDLNTISGMSTLPIVVLVKDLISRGLKDNLIELFSVRMSKCVLLFCKPQSLQDQFGMYDLLSQAKKRTVIAFEDDDDDSKEIGYLGTYLKEDVVMAKFTSAGDLLISKHCLAYGHHEHENLWLSKSKTLAKPYPKLIDAKHSCSMSLRGKSATVSVVPTPPSVIRLPDNKFTGAEISYFDMVAQKIGFQYNVLVDLAPSTQNPVTKKWNGMIGEVLYGTSQFGMGGIVMFGRDFPIDYSPATFTTGCAFLTPKPKLLSPYMNFLKPFTLTVWLLFLAALVVCSLASYTLLVIHEKRPLSLWKIVYDLYGSMWQQNLKDTSKSPYSGLFFIMFGFWIVGFFFKGAAYNCDLRAYLIRKSYDAPIESDEDLARLGLNIYLPMLTIREMLYKLSSSPVRQQIYAKAAREKTLYKFSPRIPLDFEQRMMREGGVTIVLLYQASQVLMDAEKRHGYQPFRLSRSTVENSAAPITVMFRMYEPWSDEFNSVLQHVIEAGIVEHLLYKFTPFSKYSLDLDEKDNDEDVLDPLKIEHFGGPLIVLSIGLVVSMTVFCIEWVIIKGIVWKL